MIWYETITLLLGAVVGLMAFGVPVAFAFLLINVLGVLVFFGGMVGIEQLVANATESVTTFALVPVPLFLLMGEIFFHTGMALRVFDALDKCFGRLPGRLSYLTVVGGTLFAALSGSSMANTAMLGSLMVPEMTSRGYKKHMVIGPILGTGGLAIIIPPSSLAVLLGSLARIDIGALLIAGLVPGLLLAMAYVVVIFCQVKRDPEAAPGYDVARPTAAELVKAVAANILPMGVVVFAVVGLIIVGVATPTEASAFGVISVLLLAFVYRCFSWDALTRAVEGTTRVTAMVFLIIIGSSTFSQILTFSGATPGLLGHVTGFDVSPYVMLFFMFLILLFLGMFMDQVSMMLITLPVFIPLAQSLGLDMVWFGLFILLGLEVGLVTPPFGLLLFVMLGVGPRGTTLPEVSRAAVPYILCVFVLLMVLTLFPEIALFLPAVIG